MTNLPTSSLRVSVTNEAIYFYFCLDCFGESAIRLAMTEGGGRLLRPCLLARTRNDESISNSRDSTNPPKQTIEEIAVEFLYLEKNLGAKLDLESVSLPNFSPSAKDAPKSELNAQAEFVRLWV